MIRVRWDYSPDTFVIVQTRQDGPCTTTESFGVSKEDAAQLVALIALHLHGEMSDQS